MQKARRSSIQSTKTYKAFQTFQSFMTFQPLQALLHVPAPSSTIQYLPVLSSVSRDFHPFQHFFNQIGFPPETPLSASRIQDFLQTFHSSKKGRCCDMSQYDTIGKIELIPASVLSTDKTNC